MLDTDSEDEGGGSSSGSGQRTPELDVKASLEMCIYALDLLTEELNLNGGEGDDERGVMDGMDGIKEEQQEVPEIWKHTECGLFVTYNKKNHRGDWRLRGCIGTLTKTNLSNALKTYALVAALRDHRFEPIQQGELEKLQVGVSVLSRFESCKVGVLNDWRIGRHGLIMECTYRNKRYSATFLPEVAKEQNWDHQETVVHLLRKGGYDGSITSDLLDCVKLVRYQSTKYQLEYTEYLKLVMARNKKREEEEKVVVKEEIKVNA
mmetsp:Transcript_5774/g.10368  ORF Transcript_5774/g.10368 Transcript_5774/m.10368 type:complete len:263 (-) Transcript_5774:298-1086(-)